MADMAPATPNNEARRAQMLRAAAELICERGFGETRIADVAKRAERELGPGHLLLRHPRAAARRRAALLRGELLRRRREDARRGHFGARAAVAAGALDLRPRERRRRARRVGPVVRPLGAGLPPPRGQAGPRRARRPVARHDRRRRQGRARRPARSARSTRGLRPHLRRAARRAVDPGRARGPRDRPGHGLPASR